MLCAIIKSGRAQERAVSFQWDIILPIVTVAMTRRHGMTCTGVSSEAHRLLVPPNFLAHIKLKQLQ
eukprot:8454-Heterococcus_DN1.PRE.2